MSIVNVASLRQVVDARILLQNYPGVSVNFPLTNDSSHNGLRETGIWKAHLFYAYNWNIANYSDYFWNNYYCAASNTPPPSNQWGPNSTDLYLLDPQGTGTLGGSWTDITSTAFDATAGAFTPTGLEHIHHTMQGMKADDNSKTTLPAGITSAGGGSGTWQTTNISMGAMKGFKYTRNIPSWRHPGGDNIQENLTESIAGTISFGNGCGPVTQPVGAADIIGVYTP